MDEAKIMARLKVMQGKALRVAGFVFLAHMMPFVPVDRGFLRKSGKVVIAEDGSVDVKFGDEKTEDYIDFQYHTAVNHSFVNGAMAPLVLLLHGDEEKKLKGAVHRKRYWAAYWQAIDDGKLTKFPNGARWFDVILNDKEVQRRGWFAYANAFRGIS